MFVGHVATGLALKRVGRDVNAGVLVLGAQALDVLLWAFVLLGLEQMVVPPDFAQRHYLTFVFPYSHGLAASVGWATLAFGLVWLIWSRPSRGRAATAVALAVFSHFPLDAAVHVPELPLLGQASLHVGTGLWRDHMGAALALELTLAAAATAVYLQASRLRGGRRIGMLALVAGVAAITVAWNTLPTAPAPPHVAAAQAFAVVAVVSSLAALLDRRAPGA
jgi:hypothetical protein